MAKPQKSGVTGHSQEERENKRRTYEQNVKRSEDTIRYHSVEHMILLNADGTIRFETTDNLPSEVSPSAEMMPFMTDAVLSHNHPRGSCFSGADIKAAMFLGLREIRATTARYGTFVLQRTHEIGKEPEDYEDFPYAYVNAMTSTAASIRSGISNGTIRYEDAKRIEGERMGQWLTDHAPTYGWRFRKED